jgi:hypothetical protein
MRALEQDGVKPDAAMIAAHGMHKQWLDGVVVVDLRRPALRADELDERGSQHAAEGHGKDSSDATRILKTRAERSKPTTPVDVYRLYGTRIFMLLMRPGLQVFLLFHECLRGDGFCVLKMWH